MCLEELKKEIVKKLEEQLDGSECPKCKEMSLKVIIDFVGDALDSEAECTSCGTMIPYNIDTDAPEAMKKLRKALDDIKKMFKF